MEKSCRNCQSPDLARRGKGFRDVCRSCYNAQQRQHWASHRQEHLLQSRANYAKHAHKRREESSAHKKEHRAYYTLAEWFRKKGIPLKTIDPTDFTALLEMKKALTQSKALTKNKPAP